MLTNKENRAKCVIFTWKIMSFRLIKLIENINRFYETNEYSERSFIGVLEMNYREWDSLSKKK